MKCLICGKEEIWMITTSFCPDECDRKPGIIQNEYWYAFDLVSDQKGVGDFLEDWEVTKDLIELINQVKHLKSPQPIIYKVLVDAVRFSFANLAKIVEIAWTP